MDYGQYEYKENGDEEWFHAKARRRNENSSYPFAPLRLCVKSFFILSSDFSRRLKFHRVPLQFEFSYCFREAGRAGGEKMIKFTV